MTEAQNVLFDERCILQVLGSLMLEPVLLDEYHFETEDFRDDFYILIFSAIYNLYSSGAREINKVTIDNYLSKYPEQYAIFKQNDGMAYVDDCRELAEKANFIHYHTKLKKLAYLRYVDKRGLDVRPLYDYTLSGEELEKEQKRFDAATIDDLIGKVEEKFVIDAKTKFSVSTAQKSYTIGSGIRELIDGYMETPDYGIPLLSPFLNTIYRGARLGTVSLISAPSGAGKTRVGMQNMTYFSIPWQYDLESKTWKSHGISNPVLVISTELEINELQNMVIAQVSGVNEDKIVTGGPYTDDELERIQKAEDYMRSAPFYVEVLEDFTREQIFNIIKKYHREHGVDYVFFDYIQTSMGLLSEMSKKANGIRMREDMILYQFVSSLKQLARHLNIYILSATQLSGTYHEGYKDETILRGAKAMADKIDCGEILMIPTAGELKAVEDVQPRKLGMKKPNRIKHIYKCRGGKYTKIKIFCHLDLGKMTLDDLFVTDADNVLIDIPYTNISVGDMTVGDMDIVEQVIEDNSVDMSTVSEAEVFEKITGQETREDEDAGLTASQLAMKRLGF